MTTFKEPPGIEYAVVRRVNMAFRTQPVEPPAAQQPPTEQPAPQPVDPQPQAQSPGVFIDPQTQQPYPQPEDLVPEDSVPEDPLPAAPESSAADPTEGDPTAGSGVDPGFDNGAADPSVDFQGNQGEVQIIPQADSATSGESEDLSQSIPDPVAPPEAPPGN